MNYNNENSSGSIYDQLTPEQAQTAMENYQGGMSFDDAVESALESEPVEGYGYYCGYIQDDEPVRISLDEIGIAPGYFD